MYSYLTQSRRLRISTFTAYYVAQGLPIGLISIAIPGWIADLGISNVSLAIYMSVTGLPWAFKLIAGPIMDRFSFISMGRRRPWIIGAQAGLFLSILSLGFVHDPLASFSLLIVLATIANAFAAVQDVAVDGMAIDILPVNERGRANAFMGFGQVAGYSGSGALSGILLANWGISGAAAFLSALVFLILIWCILVRERPGERLLPWSEGEASEHALELQLHSWKEIFHSLTRVLFLPASLILMTMTLFWRMGDGFFITVAPLINTQVLGNEGSVYSSWYGSVTFIAACAGLLIGPYIDRSGSMKVLLWALAAKGLACLLAAFMSPFWTEVSSLPLVLMLLLELSAQAIFISFIALHMEICWAKISATQFSIYMAWSNLARSIGAFMYALISTVVSFEGVFFIMGGMLLLGVLLVKRVNLDQHRQKLERLDRQAAGQV